MHKVGIEPLVLPNELCCGHDLLLRGETSLFESLKNKVADQIKKAGVKRIVFTCPECLVTIRHEYSDLPKEVNIEYVHLSELL